MILNIFICLDHYIPFLMSLYIFCSFLKWGCFFSYCWVLRALENILDTTPFQVCVSQIFSPIFGLSFLFTLCSAEQIFLTLMESNFSVFSPSTMLLVLHLKTNHQTLVHIDSFLESYCWFIFFIDIVLFRLFVYACDSFCRLCLSRNWSISYKL